MARTTLVLLACSLAGCAVQKLSSAIYAHEMYAAALESRGDYRGAAREQETIERMRRKLAGLESNIKAPTYPTP